MAAVDIIVPLYNKEKTVSRTVESILAQTFTDWRVIIINDGSTDNGPGIVRDFTDPRIHIIEQNNQGPGAARNTGLRAATAPYVAFLDADDQWHPWYLENAVKAIRENQISFVGSMYEEWPQQKDMTGYWAGRNVTPGFYELKSGDKLEWALAMLYFFHVGNTLVSTDIARKYGGFYDQDKCRLSEDTIFFAKLVFNEPFMIIGPAAVRHNRQDSTLSNIDTPLLSAFQTRPEAILKFCSGDKLNFARRVLTFNALRTAHYRARSGHKKDAQILLSLYPEANTFGFLYLRCRCEIALSGILKYWVRFKCLIGPPVRSWFKQRLKKEKS